MSDGSRSFRSQPSAYFIFGGIFGAMFAFSIYATLFTHFSFWKAAVSFGAAFALALVWLAAFEIRITEHELIFRSLFGGVRRLRHEDIKQVRLGVDLRGGGPLRLFVERRGTNAQEVSINAKVFSRKAIRTVLDLGARVGTADSGGLEDGLIARAVSKTKSRKKLKQK